MLSDEEKKELVDAFNFCMVPADAVEIVGEDEDNVFMKFTDGSVRSLAKEIFGLK